MSRTTVIPTFKDSESLEKLAPRIKQILLGYQTKSDNSLAILVVDDDSADGTTEAASKHGFDVIVRRGKKGPASAVIEVVNSLDGNTDNIIVMGANGQHDANLIPGRWWVATLEETVALFNKYDSVGFDMVYISNKVKAYVESPQYTYSRR